MNVMTIDVEDWYHSLEPDPARWSYFEDRIEDPVYRLLDLFDETGARATFFVLGHVAERHPGLVREIARRGHEVGSHGTCHRLVYRQSPREFEADVRASLKLLGDITGTPVTSYRAPYFSITDRSRWALPILAKLGITHDSSVFPVHNPRYGVPGAARHPHNDGDGLVEIPPSTVRIGSMNVPVAGGIYFRFFPYPWLCAAYHAILREGLPVVFYLHPWELDPGQPRVRVASGLRLRHYWNLSNTERRLRTLLREFAFGPAGKLCP